MTEPETGGHSGHAATRPVFDLFGRAGSLVPGELGSLFLFMGFYCLLGGMAFSTAYVQANAAAVWPPTGFAVGLLLARGRRFWPAILLGSFLLNASVNIFARDGATLATDIAVAFFIAIGNTFEAAIGAWLARRFSGGRDFLSNPNGLVTFSIVVAPLAALVSTLAGVSASWLGGITVPGTILEALLTWYIANVVGLLIFTGPTLLLLTGAITLPDRHRMLEALLLVACLIFISQAISGIYLTEMLNGWLKAYMVIPLLLWASFRFGTPGALFSVVLVVSITSVGTMRGFQVFSAETPSRSLLYLQIFLALLSIMALSIAATRAQVIRLQEGLEARVRDRTSEVERLLREKDVFTTVVAHDLQSPLYGVRNALRAAMDAIDHGHIQLVDVAAAMKIMEETCTTLADRVEVLLAPASNTDTMPQAADVMRIGDLVSNIVAAHRLAIDRKTATVAFSGDRMLAFRRPAEVEHILDILIENAIRYSPPGSKIEVAAYRHSGRIEILVSDNGQGIPAAEIPRLFLRRNNNGEPNGSPRHGLGLHLASEMATSLGGKLTYTTLQPHGSCFRLALSAHLETA